MPISELIRNFMQDFDINQIDGEDLYKCILRSKYNPSDLLSYIVQYKQILLHKIGSHFFFDFIYNRVTHEKGEHPNNVETWKNVLHTAIDLAKSDPNYKFLQENKRYILDLQSSNKSFVTIFKALLDAAFETGDMQFLLYSVIARGELSKFKILMQYVNVVSYPGIYDVALRYGRYQLIEHMIECDIPIHDNVLDFSNYLENCRYLYYSADIHQIDETMPAISCALQDYIRSLQLILERYTGTVTVETIYVWCDLIRCKKYLWDSIDASKVLEILRAEMIDQIQMLEDFGEYNTIIFGQWGERRFLVEKCKQLESRLLQLEERYAAVEDFRY